MAARSLRMVRRSPAPKAVAGFTLVELMIVVAIIGILAANAVASYHFARDTARRGAAEGCLHEAAQYMERFYTTNLAYDEDTAGNDVPDPVCSQDVDDFYDVGFDGAPTATTYTLKATPKATQNDTSCGTLSIDHKGVKGATGTSGPSGCW
jgi:type IV pilus assembly protein PilE